MAGHGSFSSDGIFEAGGAPPAPASLRVELREPELAGARGVRLYAREFVPEGGGTGALVALMHGYGEHCRRYDELALELARRGHVVCLFDARGHGQSPGQRGYVRKYGDYVADYQAFVRAARARHPARPLVPFGHSNGGLIVLRAIQAGLEGPVGLVLTGPLLGLPAARKAVPDALARLLSALLPRLPVPNGIRSEELTQDEPLREAHRRDRRVHRVATPRWYWEMTLAARAALAEAGRVTLPLLILLGERDRVVDGARVAEFHARAASADKQLLVRRGELHEVLNETRRSESFGVISSWIERVASGVAHAAR